jgi:hypothetical protein
VVICEPCSIFMEKIVWFLLCCASFSFTVFRWICVFHCIARSLSSWFVWNSRLTHYSLFDSPAQIRLLVADLDNKCSWFFLVFPAASKGHWFPAKCAAPVLVPSCPFCHSIFPSILISARVCRDFSFPLLLPASVWVISLLKPSPSQFPGPSGWAGSRW